MKKASSEGDPMKTFHFQMNAFLRRNVFNRNGILLFGKFGPNHSQPSLELRIHEGVFVDCERYSNSAVVNYSKVWCLVVVYFHCFVWSNFGPQITQPYETQVLGHHGLHH